MTSEPTPVGPDTPWSSESIAALFTRSDGTFLCARWGRPIAPIVFGVTDGSLATVKGAIEAVAQLAGREIAETDPELGANFMLFFVASWDDLRDVPDLDRLIPDFAPLLDRLEAAGANQYRIFRFDPGGAIRACFAFVRMDDHMRAAPADGLALTQALQAILLWSDTAFGADAQGKAAEPPFARAPDGTMYLRPGIAAVIRAAYDPVLPDAAKDPAHALRIAARMPRAQ